MILKLNQLLLTSTHTGSVWAAYVADADNSSGGMFYTGGFVITAFNTDGRVWIGNQNMDSLGEGMETNATRLQEFLCGQLFAATDAHIAEVTRTAFNQMVADFYRENF